MEAARHVGAGDDPEHGVVVAELPDAESFAQVGVEIDAGHSASLGPATMRAACGVRRSGRFSLGAATMRAACGARRSGRFSLGPATMRAACGMRRSGRFSLGPATMRAACGVRS